jgi:hypothetical protein
MQFMQKLKQKLSSMQQGGGGGRGAGGQGQFLQQMMQGQSAPGAMGRAPMGRQGMPLSQSGMGMGMAPMTQSKASQQHFTPGSLLKSASATTGGSGLSTPAAAAPAASTKSDLERQMEQEYGR